MGDGFREGKKGWRGEMQECVAEVKEDGGGEDER